VGRLEDDLEALRREVEELEVSDPSSREERERQLERLIGAILHGEDTSEFEPNEVARMQATLQRIAPAAKRVAERLAAKGWVSRQDGSWGPEYGSVSEAD
jgi:polynucleotide 5'-kinase involved in rRNA processing